MTHDVETEKGKAFCTTLMDIDDEFDIKSSIPNRAGRALRGH